MQLSFQTGSTASENLSVNSYGSAQGISKGVVNNFKEAQQSLLSHKSQNEVYRNSRIYSPYLSPSCVVVADKILQKNSFSPIYVHNAAITKSYLISKPALPKDHTKINIVV